MADGAVAADGGGAADAAGAEAEQPQQSWFEMLKGIFWRFLIMYFIMSLFKGGANKTAAPTEVASSSNSNGEMTTTNSLKGRNLFDRGTVMDMYLYLSEYERMRWKGEDQKISTGI